MGSSSNDTRHKKIPVSVFERTQEIILLAAQIGGRELGHRVSKVFDGNNPLARLHHQIEQTKLLVESLKHLKGAALKAGQLLSMESRDFLPPEVCQILDTLQDASSSLEAEVVQKILMREWGETRFAKLEQLDLRPFASASIGQVHVARWEGETIALKIQFPEIAKAISSDLKALENIAEAYCRIAGKEIDLQPFFHEIETMLMNETDYRQEARNLEEFREHFANKPDFLIPHTLPELCTSQVLAMSFEDGLKFGDWLDADPNQEEREHYGRLILELYVSEFFEKGIVQTDPNFGNFLFRTADRKLVLLDFGSVKRYPAEFRERYKNFLRTLASGTDDDLIQAAQGFGLLHPEESSPCQEAFLEMMHLSWKPFQPELQPFDCKDELFNQQIRQSILKYTKLSRSSALPHEIIFLHRKLGGVFSFLKRLNVKLDLSSYGARILAN